MSLKDVLAELQKTYVASIPTKIIYIEALWRTLEIELMKTEFHKLKGTGRTYGLPEISQIGAVMERGCEIDKHPYMLLAQALPHAIELMNLTRELRENGSVPALENEKAYQALIGLFGWPIERKVR